MADKKQEFFDEDLVAIVHDARSSSIAPIRRKVAEEVAEVYPDLVVKGADGQVETVQYHKLTPMMLNELQKHHLETEKKLRQQDETVRRQREQSPDLQLQTVVRGIENGADLLWTSGIRRCESGGKADVRPCHKGGRNEAARKISGSPQTAR